MAGSNETGTGIFLGPLRKFVARFAVPQTILKGPLRGLNKEVQDLWFGGGGVEPGGTAWRIDSVNAFRLTLFPRLVTADDDPTDPGLSYGIDWVLAVGIKPAALATNTDPFGTQLDNAALPLAAADMIKLATTFLQGSAVAGGSGGFYNDISWLPEPGIPLDMTLTRPAVPLPWLAMQLIMSTQAAAAAPNACAVVSLTGLESYTA